MSTENAFSFCSHVLSSSWACIVWSEHSSFLVRFCLWAPLSFERGNSADLAVSQLGHWGTWSSLPGLRSLRNLKTAFKNSKKCKENASNSGVEWNQRLEGSHWSSLLQAIACNIMSDFGFYPAKPFLGSYCRKPRSLLKRITHLADMLCLSRGRKSISSCSLKSW